MTTPLSQTATNVMVFHPDPEAREILGFYLQQSTQSTIHLCERFADVFSGRVRLQQINLLVVDASAEGLAILHHLRQLEFKIPVIQLESPTGLATPLPPNMDDLGRVRPGEHLRKIFDLIHERFRTEPWRANEHEFCQVGVPLLATLSSVNADIYIRLSDQKYVKLFKAGTTLTPTELEKLLRSRKVRSLFVKTAECEEMINDLSRELQRLLNSPPVPALQGDQLLLESHELIQDASHKLGFTPEIQNLADKHLRLMLKQIGGNPQLNQVLALALKSAAKFVPHHSLLLGHVACAIALQMEWPSESTFKKLAMAALFHDFGFSNPEFAKVSSPQELQAARAQWGPEAQEEIMGHPFRNSEILRHLPEATEEVLTLVLQHHERPDGSGFPNALKTHQMMALSSFFIVANEIVESYFKDPIQFNFRQFLESRKASYDGGAFRKIWQNLSQGLK